jgi:hypothetical protein
MDSTCNNTGPIAEAIIYDGSVRCGGYGLSVTGKSTRLEVLFGPREIICQQVVTSMNLALSDEKNMSERWNYWDEAPIEREFRRFKSEWMPSEDYGTFAGQRKILNKSLLDYYNF